MSAPVPVYVLVRISTDAYDVDSVDIIGTTLSKEVADKALEEVRSYNSIFAQRYRYRYRIVQSPLTDDAQELAQSSGSTAL